ncbi:CRISPR-associated protein Cas4 [Schleiferilactobacillus perolens]|jgi:CRISPR-associated exonuclease Cas4|uniref:CRISPR-associated protein Cas4 n=1 Tax=Schleiferilactobacillus perolens TaxID=100468 RepID=UPI002355C2C6|nr:CRISPR-associated protein Cas4 [Schleiferilactobacillus perolens]MCI2170592.1 CRISPR-associated protein Cas4 [Schleiferilactobacillus perolens]
MYDEDDWLMISGIQHFVFCRRQWALIHIEDQWVENILTYEGQEKHKRAGDPKFREKRKDVIVERALRVHSPTLGVTGVCDVVEFHKSSTGVRLSKYPGLYVPLVVEYKRGREKKNLSDVLQLALETMCLEEMLGTTITTGDLYYFATNKRISIPIDEELRNTAKKTVQEMHNYWEKKYTPIVKTGKWCNRCSLKDICLPVLEHRQNVRIYMEERLGEE